MKLESNPYQLYNKISERVKELDNKEVLTYSLRRILGYISKLFSPGYSSCYRCGITWKFTEGHITKYNEYNGCFPLCEHCWSILDTSANRLIYYHQLWTKWSLYTPIIRKEWDAIKRAIYKGK